MNPPISMVGTARCTDTKPTTADVVASAIRSGRWRAKVENIRRRYAEAVAAGEDAKAAVRALKEALPAVLWSGLFKRRVAGQIESYSGLLCLDLDNLGDRLADVRTKLEADAHTWTVFLSPTGSGLKAVFRVPVPSARAEGEGQPTYADRVVAHHAACYDAAHVHCLAVASVEPDRAASDLARLCFVSFDPALRVNPDAVPLPPVDPKPTVQAVVTPPAAPMPVLTSPADDLALAREALDHVFPDDYGVWTEIGMALFHSFGPAGLPLWVAWSGRSAKFKPGEPEKKWSSFATHTGAAVTVASIFYRAKENGWQPPPGHLRSVPLSKPEDTIEAELQRLAGLSAIQYDKERLAAAERLNIRTSTLDDEVRARQPQSDTAAGVEVLLPDVEPWPEPVDGATALDSTSKNFSRYLVSPPSATDAIALWAAHCHCFDAFIHSPRLNLFSPEKGCGKTTALDVIAALVPRPLRTESITAPVLFRIVEKSKPTLLLDECDSYLNEAEELRGLLNAGHKRGAVALRCEGETNQVRAFKCYGPAALAGIGALPGTLIDRSIVIRLVRAKPGEIPARFDSRHTEAEAELCRKLARWTADNFGRLEAADPTLPAGAHNRLADNWRPLFAIAEVAGGDWPRRAAEAFAKLTAGEDIDGQGIGAMLLADIRSAFTEAGAPRLFSKKLVDQLCAMSDRPWPEAHRGKPISETWLARRLKSFGVQPKTLRIAGERAKGYETGDFMDAWQRYLPDTPVSKRDTVTSPDFTRVCSTSQSVTPLELVTASEVPETRDSIELSRCHGSKTPYPGENEPADEI